MNDQGPTQQPTPQPEPRARRSRHRSALREWLENIGLVAPKDAPDKWAHRRGEPRGFAVLWMFFLLFSTLLVFLTLGDPVRVTAEGYREGARMLITVISIGITVLWPMLRLSQLGAIGGGPIVIAKDLIILLVPLQAVLWPQAIITGWSFEAVAATAVVIVSWALIVGSMLALALGPGRRVRAFELPLDPDQAQRPGIERTFWMLSVLAVVGGAPLLLICLRSIGRGTSGDLEQLLRMASPLTAPWEILQNRIWTGRHAVIGPAHWRVTWMTACIAVSCWILVAIWRSTRGGGVASRADSA